MDAPIPFAGCFSAESDPTLPLVFAGLPCDAQSTFRRGPAEGPSRIRLAYDGRCYNATTELGADLGGLVSDAGDWFHAGSWEETREDYRFRAEELLAGEAVPFFAGGDHAITMPLVEALEVLEEPVHVVQLDAHLDRMFDSARAMAFRELPTRAEVKRALFETLQANGMRDGAHIRLTLTRGPKVTSGMKGAFCPWSFSSAGL